MLFVYLIRSGFWPAICLVSFGKQEEEIKKLLAMILELRMHFKRDAKLCQLVLTGSRLQSLALCPRTLFIRKEMRHYSNWSVIKGKPFRGLSDPHAPGVPLQPYMSLLAIVFPLKLPTARV